LVVEEQHPQVKELAEQIVHLHLLPQLEVVVLEVLEMLVLLPDYLVDPVEVEPEVGHQRVLQEVAAQQDKEMQALQVFITQDIILVVAVVVAQVRQDQ
jgi:hypothetical protein